MPILLDRRRLLHATLVGTGGFGACALGVYLPRRRGDALPPGGPGPRPRLLFVTSRHGEPLGANAPGSYDDANLVHPAHPAARPLPFGPGNGPGGRCLGAALWRGLPATWRTRCAFVHHRPRGAQHAGWHAGLRLADGKLLPAALAARLAGDGQPGPPAVCVGPQDERWGDGAARPPQLTPMRLVEALAPGLDGRAAQAATLAWLRRRHGAAAAEAHEAARHGVAAALAGIHDDGPEAQLAAAAALFALDLTPVVSVHLPWGGDNHRDAGLLGEVTQQAASVAALAAFYRRCAALQLGDAVTTLVLPHFGRTLARHHKGDAGRDHNAGCNTALLLGANVRGGVVGSLRREGADYVACRNAPGHGVGAAPVHGGPAYTLDDVAALAFAALAPTA